MDSDPTFPFASRRSAVYGTRGACASSQPLASSAGLEILRKGGNAADAAVAMAACLNVTEPCSTGLGGDCFVLYFDAKTKRVRTILGNGAAPAALTLDLVQSRGIKDCFPERSGLAVTIPGAAAAWEDTVREFGRLPLRDVLAPAIELAEQGFAIGPITASLWAEGADSLQGPGRDALLPGPGGRAPRLGERVRNADLAATLRALGERGARDGFYTGRVADAIVEAVAAAGGVMAAGDLAAHSSDMGQEPISIRYRDITVYEVPPPTQGLAAVLALNTLQHLHPSPPPPAAPPAAPSAPLAAAAAITGDPSIVDATTSRPAKGAPSATATGHAPPLPPAGSAEQLHRRIESMRLAFADIVRHVGDPRFVSVPVRELLAPGFAARRAAAVDPARAAPELAPGDTAEAPRGAGPPAGSDTVYFCAVDAEGNGCSMINSNYTGFGSGIVPRGCGFSLQNRGLGFSLEEGQPNTVGPGRRPFHTIIPALATDSDGELWAVFGVMGGFMQAQGHMQVLSNMVDYGMDPQQAVDAPRFCITPPDDAPAGFCALPDGGRRPAIVALEEGIPAEVQVRLSEMGHPVVGPVGGAARCSLFGRGQIIRRLHDGVLACGSDPRADGHAVAY